MPKRDFVLANGQIYHVYNRSIGKENIFNNNRHNWRALDLLDYYRFSHRKRYSHFKALSNIEKKNYFSKIEKSAPLVEIYVFALMPNHFHFLLKQLRDKGISKFLSNFQNSFAKYFNLKNSRTGSLFQNMFKAKIIENERDLLNVSRYIHLNPVDSFIIQAEELINYSWTSFSSYFGKNSLKFVSTDFILNMFRSKGDYKRFTFNEDDYKKEMKKIRRFLLEKPLGVA